jgi:hypothetical protein
MKELLPNIVIAAITVLLNLIFYIIIRKGIEKSIEKSKIIYTGIFKEKIDIYKNILGEVHDLKLKLNRYQYDMAEFRTEIQEDFNRLIRIYLVNSPFLSDTLIELFKKNTSELQDIFGAMVSANLKHYGMMPHEEIKKREEAYWVAVNKLRENEVLKSIEERIIKEMRIDLQTD